MSSIKLQRIKRRAGIQHRQGKPDATREQMDEAARATYIHNFISVTPKGYDTVVDAHEILVMDAGPILERGTHAALHQSAAE